MADPRSLGLSRRAFFMVGLAGGAIALGGVAVGRKIFGDDGPVTDPRVFLHIASDDTVTVLIKHLEMGQGIMTGLSTLVAEELDADWSQIEAKLAPGNQTLFQNNLYGRQATAASTSVKNSWMQMRQIGATARAMFVTAAAREWGVPEAEIDIRAGVISHQASGREAGFGAFAEAAMAEDLPSVETLRLKAPGDWTLIGQSLARPDAPAKLNGTAGFSIDVRRPGMVQGVVARAPRFGATLDRFDATAALAVPGVLEVFAVPSGVAVLAENTWAAIKGREALETTWDNTQAEMRSSDAFFEDYKAHAFGEGGVAAERGDLAPGFEVATIVREFEYTFPYLAHAPLEPLNAVIETHAEGARVWAGCQLHTLDQWAVADALGVDRDAVEIETPFTGSSFGRRAYSRSDWMVELAHVAKNSRLGRPIQILWTREDDIAGGVYRPLTLHRARVGMDGDGRLVAWDHDVVSQSLIQNTPWAQYLREDGFDRIIASGVANLPYDVPAFRVSVHDPQSPVPVGFWRSVGDSHNKFATETILDVMAHETGQDPLALRLAHLGDEHEQLRARHVLNDVADLSGWFDRGGRALGLAMTTESILGSSTHVGMVTEVAEVDGAPRVVRVYVSVDCGVPINPNIIRTQVESSISYAYSTVFRNAISLKDGVVEQSNFHDYEPTRFDEMPEIEIRIVQTDVTPSGIGEAAVSTFAPSALNAIFALTGQRFDRLPIG